MAKAKAKEVTVPKFKETIEALYAQIQQHQVMILKAQGAIEVLTQLKED